MDKRFDEKLRLLSQDVRSNPKDITKSWVLSYYGLLAGDYMSLTIPPWQYLQKSAHKSDDKKLAAILLDLFPTPGALDCLRFFIITNRLKFIDFLETVVQVQSGTPEKEKPKIKKNIVTKVFAHKHTFFAELTKPSTIESLQDLTTATYIIEYCTVAPAELAEALRLLQ